MDYLTGRFLRRSLALIVFCSLPLAVACAPADDQGASGEAVESDSAAATVVPAGGKGGLRHRPINRLGRPGAGGGRLKLVYGRLTLEEHRELEAVFREERFFEDILQGLNESLILPRDLPVRLEECEEINAFYDGEDGSISLCYELLGHFLELFGSQVEGDSEEEQEEVGAKAVAALVFAFYHELGHALIDIYNLPATGREEDAVDQLATVMLLETWDGEDSELAILSSAEWFDLGSLEREEEPDMADEHALEEQRYYNLICWIYGSDPEYFADVASDWGLPEARAERCESEYHRMSQAWDALLGPHLRPVKG